MSALPAQPATTTLETAPFWEAAASGRLVLPRCDGCGEFIWYPRRFCPSCHSRSVSWSDATGRGHVYSFTIVRRGSGRWTAAAPYVIAYVELEEGPRVMTNIVDCEPDDVVIGLQVVVTFDDAGDGAAIPRFRPA